MTKIIKVIVGLCALLALATLLDFCFNGETYTEALEQQSKKKQRYYNAGGNSHYTYDANTANFNIPITEAFKDSLLPTDTLNVTTSLFFNEINKTENIRTSIKETHSMRYFSGLAIPLLFFLVVEIIRRRGNKLHTLLFVLCVLTVANFVYILN